MSFITKRERVFNEYELLELPPRNEGKLKAYASCTDARAWSHFCSDKTEHLVEIIKRNNDICRPKYLPTDVIVQTLMVAKNAEITRLKRKIEEFEQMLAAYDQLELTCEQKCEIATAHAAIKAANKELDELCLDLDLSGFTEGMDSDAFETGKSRGDEPDRYRHDEAETSRRSESVKSRGDEWSFEKEPPKTDTKGNQTGLVCPCDMSTSAEDPRIQEMQDTIIGKDAKLNAMRNTIAVMENDVCEPYCIYAHIYTALEKIFGVLCQNDKYKLYLSLMTAGKDIRCIDITGKILFKLKVLEKFGKALIAPCSQEQASNSSLDCACLRAEVIERLDFQLTSESKQPSRDNKRAQLVADIMANDEMKEILSKESCSEKNDDNQIEDLDNYSIDNENLKRLKNLQENYDELMICYEKLKYEKDNLQTRCKKYEELEEDCENLKCQLREYNSLWNEKEHYRKRSLDVDSLKEQYLILADETSNLETQLNAESEINLMKTNTIEDLRSANLALEKKLNDALIAFEKEKNTIQCKLKETECTVMCQDQQIKSLSAQIDRFIEQGHDKVLSSDDPSKSLALIDQIESLKEQINNLKESLFCSEDEKQQLLEQFQDKLGIINDLRMEIEDWKNSFKKEVQRLLEENKALSDDAEEKSMAVENLKNIVDNRSQEIQSLRDTLEEKDNEKKILTIRYQDLRNLYDHSITTLENEKIKALQSLHLARQESQELLDKLNEYNIVPNAGETSTRAETKSYLDKSESILMNEIQKLRDTNANAISSIGSLQEVNKKKSEVLEDKLKQFERVSDEMKLLKFDYNNLLKEKDKLEKDLMQKKAELDNALMSIQLSQKESSELINKLDHFKILEEELNKLKNAYDQLMIEKEGLQQQLLEKNQEVESFSQSLNNKNDDLKNTLQKINKLEKELHSLKIDNEELMKENNNLQDHLDKKERTLSSLHNKLESQNKENLNLQEKVEALESYQKTANDNIKAIQNEYVSSQTALAGIRKESAALIVKLQNLELLENEYDILSHKNESLQEELNRLTAAIKRLKDDNNDLNNENQTLQTINKDIEQSLIEARNQLLAKPGSPRLSSEDILRQIESLKKEKVQSESKIKNLIHKLDESESIISNLTENLLARDDKIAILENYINGLKDEISKLHENLDNVIETGEQISTNSSEKFDQTLKSLEAHQSRATHNIKMEVAKLKNENLKLEEQLSVTKFKSAESTHDKNKYLSQVIHLQNEREVIVNDIKELELFSVGDSALSPQQCSLDDIQDALNHIRKSIHTKISKSSSLELTIQKVQNSSQILLTKADEAKKIVEKEKQKIIMEKEEAIREKINMENKLSALRKKLENQISNDQEIVKDLEARIQNQQLIAQNAISKLETELQELQTAYQNSISEIEKLQEKLRELLEKNKNYLKENELLNKELIQKTETITKTEKELEDLKNKKTQDISIQAELPIKINMSSQTEKYLIASYEKGLLTSEPNISKKNRTVNKEIEKISSQVSMLQSTKTTEVNPVSSFMPKQTPNSINEVQVLTANIESAFDSERSRNLNYKMQHLAPGRLEQYSILDEQPFKKSSRNEDLASEQDENDPKLTDIYNRSANVTSSKAAVSKKNKSHRLELANDDVNDEDKIQKKRKHISISEPLKVPDNDELVFYNEPLAKTTKNLLEDTNTNIQLQTKVKTDPKQRSSQDKKNKQSEKPKFLSRSKHYRQIEDEEYDEDDSVKPKLNIDLPRVNNESLSIITTSETDKKSTDSEILNIYTSPKRSSLTDTQMFSDTGIKIIKQESPSLPTLSNEHANLDSYNSIGKSSDTEQNNRDQENMRIEDLRNQILELTNRDRNLSDDDLELIRRNKNFKKANDENNLSHHDLARVEADPYLIKPKYNKKRVYDIEKVSEPRSFALDYILNTVRQEVDPENVKELNVMRDSPRSKSDERLHQVKTARTYDLMPLKDYPYKFSSLEYQTMTSPRQSGSKIEQGVMAKADEVKDYEEKIKYLTNSLEITERDYKKKLSAIKTQYDSNIKNIINEHNQGVKNIQGLHEETLQDIIKIHENEIENLRSMSIEANRKAEKLEKENRSLKSLIDDNSTTGLDEEPIKICPETKSHRKSRYDSKMLTKTNIVACNVKPKTKSYGPCTCSLDVNVSDTIKNIFEQVNVEQRKTAEHTYIKYIANKILSGNVEVLDAQELSYLHLKVCRTWKVKMSQEEALQKRIDNLESELINRQRHAQQHIAELDRKVEEEKRRLQEVREAVCRNSPAPSRTGSPDSIGQSVPMVPPSPTVDAEFSCACNTGVCGVEVNERRSAGDLAHTIMNATVRPKRTRPESHRAVSAKLNTEERKEKKFYHDEPPTRLRRSHDRHMPRAPKK